jgi:outer membrane protein OmpA-like peptidoglycan-associated protein
MADLEVQPKKKGSILPWLLLALGVLALIIFLARGCNDREPDTSTGAASPDTLTSTGGTATTATPGTGDGWGDVDFNAPAVQYEEITNQDITVRGNNRYGIYGIGEDILFDENKSTIRSEAEQNLRQIAASIQKRYGSGEVRVYGYTDAQGSAGYNRQLAEQRAEAVRNWLTSNGSVGADRITLHPVGESRPVASNATEEGRQQNRRVEIVARGSGSDSTGGRP